MDLPSVSIGRAGEYLAASIFEMQGITTVHVDVTGVDLWVETPSGRRVTVQVKAASEAKVQPDRKSKRYRFNLYCKQTHTRAEVFCFVALDKKQLRLVSSAEARSSYKAFTEADFDESLMLSDINRYLY